MTGIPTIGGPPAGKPLIDQEARDRMVADLGASIFVEAGAGTGKTSALVGRIVATVADSEDRVPVRNLAAITFTDKAAGELRSRVHRALAERAADATPAEADWLTEQLRDLDAAAIGTIHSFALALLREHCLAAGLPIGFEVADEGTVSVQKRERWRSVHTRWVNDLSATSRAALEYAGVRLTDLGALVDSLDANRARLAAREVQWDYRVNANDAVAQAATDLRTWLEATLAGCGDLSDKLALHLQEKVVTLCDRLTDLASLAPADALAVQLQMARNWASSWAPGGDLGWGAAFKPGNVGAKKAWGEGGAQAVRNELKSFEAEIQGALFAPVENAIREALDLAHDEFEIQTQRRCADGLLEYDDLLVRARDLLAADADVRAAVHERFRVVLVDEFQDTDPVQWEIVRLVTGAPDDSSLAPKPGRLVVVGDPKQAIYSFRGADIATYLQAGHQFPGEQVALSTNFRTVRPVLEWVNAVFGTAIIAGPVQARYENLLVRHDPSSTQPTGPAVVVLATPTGDGHEGADPVTVDGTSTGSLAGAEAGADAAAAAPPIPANAPDLRRESLLVADAITRAVVDGWQITERVPDSGERRYTRAATFRDVAILLPVRTGIDELLTALDDAHVPYRSGDAAVVYGRPMAVGLVAAVGAIADRGAQLDVWAALKSPLFGCSDADLLAHRRAGGRWVLPWPDVDVPPGRVGEALRLLAELRDEWLSPAPVDVLSALVARCRVFEVLAVSPRGDFDADCVRMVLDHAASWQHGGGVGLEDYLRWVEVATNPTSRAKLAEADDRDDDAVQIMTVHAAKGLEFPIVVVAGMTTKRRNSPPATGLDADGRVEFSTSGLGPPVGLGKLRSAGYVQWEELEYAPREDAELLRLLYVACTRARDHLVVSVVGDPEGKADSRARALRSAVLGVGFSDAVEAQYQPTVVVGDRHMGGARRSRPSALPPGWADDLTRIRHRSAMASVTSPSGGAVHLGSADSDGVGKSDDTNTSDGVPVSQSSSAADLMPGQGSSVEALPDSAGHQQAWEGLGEDDRAVGVGRAARDGRPLGRAVHGALDVILSAGSTPTQATVAAASARTAVDEGIPGEASEVQRRVQTAVASSLVQQALAGRRWTELYLAAPLDAGPLTMVEGYADLVFEINGDEGTRPGLVLVDYKTDATLDDVTLDHYRDQLLAYRQLLEQATGLSVAEVWVLHLAGETARPIQLA